MPLLLRICFYFIMKEIPWSLSHGKIRLTLLRLSIPLLDIFIYGLLNIDNIYFDHMVDRIFPAELQLNKANSSDTEAPFLVWIYQYLMVRFQLKSMINGTILILI